jgi:hypothetical protein
MKKVVFGGSRRLGRLNDAIRERADNIVAREYLVLIGDANGADRAMQEYLAQKTYPHVLVFCAGSTCRNNVGRWETRFVPSDKPRRSFESYVVRDKKMIEEADYGFMVWDGKSKGTLNNIINLLDTAKPVLVYFSPNSTFLTLKSMHDLTDFLSSCDGQAKETLQDLLRLSCHGCPEQSRLSFQ